MSREKRRNYWHSLVVKQAESGLSAAAFCREHNLHQDQFYRWRRGFRRATTANNEQVVEGFVQLVPSSRNLASGVRIVLGQGISIEVERNFDSATLHAAVTALFRA